MLTSKGVDCGFGRYPKPLDRENRVTPYSIHSFYPLCSETLIGEIDPSLRGISMCGFREIVYAQSFS